MIIDSHCHLNYEPISLSVEKVIKRANEEGVGLMLTIATEDKNFNNILKIVENYNCVYGTYGIHPHEAKLHKRSVIEKPVSNMHSEHDTFTA